MQASPIVRKAIRNLQHSVLCRKDTRRDSWNSVCCIYCDHGCTHEGWKEGNVAQRSIILNFYFIKKYDVIKRSSYTRVVGEDESPL